MRFRKSSLFTLVLSVILTAVIWIGIPVLADAETVTGNEWTTPQDVRVNQTDHRAVVIPFNDVESARKNPTLKLGQDSPNYIDLAGTWKFNWVDKPASKPNVSGVTSIPSSYFDITVPSSWQTNMKYAGWKGTEIDWPIYSNQTYPWQSSGNGISGQSMGNGSAAPSAYNPVGTYMRYVDIPSADIGNRFIITFLGVESGFYLYVNGQAVGYGEDSFTTCEFDITDYLVAGQNLITAQVYHWTTGSYLENADMIYYAGIHRDVFITKQPKVSIYDYNVETTFENHDYTSGTLELDVDVTNTTAAVVSSYQVKAYLYDEEGAAVSGANGVAVNVSPAAGSKATARFSIEVSNPKLWSAEFPNLYTLVMELCDANGNSMQTVGKRIGFREFYMENAGTSNSTSNMRINGQNIEFYGVNRGEADPKGGHHIPYETIVKDVENAKRLNINAIRTSHFPADPNLVELADEYGLYIMDEVNVESHDGRASVNIPTADRYEPNTSSGARIFPGNDKRYTNAMVDRMTTMIMRDKNNPSVIIYSLGNEAGSDVSDRSDANRGNFNRMIDVIKELDDEKLIHYQGWSGNSRVDMCGTMYPSGYSQSWTDNTESRKPYIMMEYNHMMGNTGGDLHKYTDVFENDYRRQGGFIWDYVDQSAYTPINGTGGEGLTADDLYLGFDGSWRMHSSNTRLNFCVNGFIFPDRTWKPSAYEVKQNYQDLKFTQTEVQKLNKQVVIHNYNRFKNANYYNIVWTLLEDGAELQTGILTDEQANLAPPTGNIAAGSTKTVTIPYQTQVLKEGSEYLLLVEYKLKEETVYAPKDYVQGSDQFTLPEGVKGSDKTIVVEELPEVNTQESDTEVTVTGTTEEGRDFTVTVNKQTGLMTTYKVDGKDLISRAPVGSFFRAETDQNATINGVNWLTRGEAYDAWYDQGEDMTNVVVNTLGTSANFTKISVTAKLKNGSDYATTYTVYGNATVVVTAKLTPSSSAPTTLGEYGMWMQVPSDYENLTWYGRGPGETYWDRKGSNTIGLWEDTTVTEQFVPYLRVTENGNKTDVRWLALRDDDGVGLLAGMTYSEGYEGMPLEAVALHYTAGALSSWRNGIRYPHQAVKTDDVVLRLLTHQKGVGNLDWGNDPKDAMINKGDLDLLDYSYTLMPLFEDTDPMEKSKGIIGETPEVPGITSIRLDEWKVSGFSTDKFEYDVELPSDYTGLPVIEARGPSTLDIEVDQVTSLPGTAVVNVTYNGMTVRYRINIKIAEMLTDLYLCDVISMPSSLEGTSQSGATTSVRPAYCGSLLYAYSAYHGIYLDQNETASPLTAGPANAQTVYSHGWAGNTEQIVDIDISAYEATAFSGIGATDWILKPGHNTTQMIFEVWAHKEVSELTDEYYNNSSNINPTTSSNGTANWEAAGWTKLETSGQVRANAANPKYEFSDVDLTYQEGGQTKYYQAIRLVMNANGNNGHGQGLWGDPKLTVPGTDSSGSGLEEPTEPVFTGIRINGQDLEEFSEDIYEYTIDLNYGAAIPNVTAVYDVEFPVPVIVTQAASLPGDAVITYDNGEQVTYTIHFTRAAAMTGDSVYLSDVINIPALNGPEGIAGAGNMLYAFSGYHGIYQNESEGAAVDGVLDQTLKLRESGTASDNLVIKTYDHGFAGNAQQIIDIDISSQSASRFTSDAGIDWVMKPDSGSSNANGPTVRFEIWAHMDASQLSNRYYSGMAPSANGTAPNTVVQSGWIKLDESPIMSNYQYTGGLAVQRDLYSFDVDLTYELGGETRSYEAIRLVMDPVNENNSNDQGIWGDPVVEFAEIEAPPMTVSVGNTVVTEEDITLNYLINTNTSVSQTYFHTILAVYDDENRMVGYQAMERSTDNGNIDESIRAASAAGQKELAFMIWYKEDPRKPVFGAYTREAADGSEYQYSPLPNIGRNAQNPDISLSYDTEQNTVTVTGTGFVPRSVLTLLGSYAKEAAPDHAAQITADTSGSFTYTYKSNYSFGAEPEVGVTVGGQGLDQIVRAGMTDNDSKKPVDNKAGSTTTTYNGSAIQVSSLTSLFTIDSNAGARTYTIESGGTGAGTLTNDFLTVTKAGTFRIGLVTAQTQTHQAGAKVIAVLTVDKGSRNVPAAPVLSGKTTTTVSLKAVSGMEYSADGKSWQSSAKFTGLKPETSYTFYQRYAATDLYQVSAASTGLKVKVTAPAKGTSFISGKLKYKITKKATAKAAGTVQVVGPVKKTNTKITIKASVKHETLSYKVVSIAKNAFKSNKKLKTVVIGKNVKTIGNQAFSGCSVLKKVTIGKGVTTIGNKAFNNAKKLKNITIKSTKLNKVGSKALRNIHKNATIKVPAKKLSKYRNLFKNKGQKKTVKIK